MKKSFAKKNRSLFPAIFIFLPLFLFLFFTGASAQRSYSYYAVDAVIKVNRDTTLDIEESQTFDFSGTYNKGFRSIPHNKIDGISDISVIDAATGVPLVYSSKKLEKTDPENWGKYTYYKENGATNIEWYYNVSNASHAWILKYKVHGALAFGKEADRLYWNIFTDYEVPVRRSTVFVGLPQKVPAEKIIKISYRTGDSPITESFNGMEFFFSADGFKSGDDFTVDVSWPKGVVDQSAYWRDLIPSIIGYILAVLVAIGSIIFTIIYWYMTEVHKKGRGVIVPQYEPPDNLRPAMAEVILTETISNRTWAATLIDLAIRGHIRIKEEQNSLGNYARGFAGHVVFILLIFIVPIFSVFLTGSSDEGPRDYFLAALAILFPAIVVLVPAAIIKKAKGGDLLAAKDYTIEKTPGFKGAADMKDYERSFLSTLFLCKDYFSTRELRKKGQQVDLVQRMEIVKDLILEETELDTAAFEIGPTSEKKKKYIVIFLAVGFFVMAQFGGVVWPYINQWSVFTLVSAICAIAVFAFVKYEARLSARGHLLKEEWLGFKMFLEYFGRYRWKNVTPDMFEKYLPYAIIFGVEKKWSKAFEQMHIAPPNWYVAAGVGFGHSSYAGSGASSFSASAFSASLSSSFSSAFSSSAGGGGAGGGGAGGGGGGGGGGAS